MRLIFRSNNYTYIIFYAAILLLNIGTLFRGFASINTILHIFKLVSIILLSLIILDDILKRRYTNKEFLILVVLLILGCLIYLKTQYLFIVKNIIILASCRNIDFRKIIKADFFIKIACTLIIIFTYLVTIKYSPIFTREDSTIRYSLGFYHPNTLALTSIILIFYYTYLHKNRINYSNILSISILTAIIFIITSSRSFLLLSIIYLIYLTLNSKTKNTSSTKHIAKIAILTLICSFVLSIIVTLIPANYNGLSSLLNSRLGSRPWIQNYFINEYGFSILGSQISANMVLDNSYIKMLVCYGGIGTIIILKIFISNILEAKKNNETALLFIFFIFSLYALTESLHFDIVYNFFLVYFVTKHNPVEILTRDKHYENTLVSIIIPCLNSEQYIESCIRSVLRQDHRKIEVIIIDNGSIDRTAQIINSYASLDRRIHSFYQPTTCVSSARNLGIKKSSGKYICFVDSDDIVSSTYISDFLTSISRKKNTIAICNYKNFTRSYINDKYAFAHEVNSQKATIKTLFTKYQGFLWNKIYERNIIIKNKIVFREDISMCEDLLFNIEYFRYIDSISFIEHKNYGYRKTRESITRSLKNIRWFTIYKAYDNIISEIKKYNYNIKDIVYYNYEMFLYDGINRCDFIDKKYKTATLMDIKKRQRALNEETDYQYSAIESMKLWIYKKLPRLVFSYRTR